jgi:helicase domain protein
VSRGMLKGLIKRKENLTAKIATIQYQMNQNKDAVVDFKQMGIDHIFVDESHYQNFLRLPIFTHIALKFNDSAIALIQINFMLGHSPTKTLNDSIKIKTKTTEAPSVHEGHRLRRRLHR